MKSLVLGAAVVAFVLGCGGGGTSTSTPLTQSYVGTQQPGDVWAWTLGESTFSGSNETLGHSYAGSLETLPSGFKLLTVESTTDPGASVGGKAYALDLPGTCLLVKPVDGDGAIIATGQGANPTADAFDMNWVVIPRQGYDHNTDDAFGTASFVRNDSGYHINIDFGRMNYGGGELEQGSGADLALVDGRYVVSGEAMVFGLQRSGVFFGDNGPNAGGIIGMNRSSLAWSDVAAKSFNGMIVNSGRTNLGTMLPSSTPGVIDGFGLTTDEEISTGVGTGGNHIQLQLAQDFGGGLFAVDMIRSGAPNQRCYFVGGTVGGKSMLFGFGGDGSDTYNVLMVEK